MKFVSIVLSGLLAVSPVMARPAAKLPVIRSQADLPETRFKLNQPASESYAGSAFLTETIPALRIEAERLLGGYRIEDPRVAQRLHTGLAAIAILQNRPVDAQDLIAEQRRLEAKPQLKVIGFMTANAIAAGLAAGTDKCTAAAANLTATLKSTDPVLVRDEVLTRYSRIQTASIGYYAGAAGGMIDPEQQNRGGTIGIMEGLLMAYWRVEAIQIPTCRTEMAAALKVWLDTPANKPVNVWAARQPSLTAFVAAKPVTVAVWESGFDTSLFPGQMAYDPAEPLDGKDNDGNGIADDIYGPTYDYHLRPSNAGLPPLSDWMAARWGLQMAVEKGQLDLNYGDDTPEARFFAQRARDASVDEQIEDVRGGVEFSARSHATWVASIIADGAPYVRLYNANVLPFGANPDPMPVLEDDIDRWVAVMPALAARMRGANVRIINMSWKLAPGEFAEILMMTGAETDPAKAKTRGEAMLARMRTALYSFIQSCPDILFVMGAGNTDQSAESLGSIPQTFDLPNILVVGATGMSGRATTFTSYGKHVKLYAPGEGVNLRAPGGMLMRSSGTSFSSPMAARVAAQMLAVKPSLTPQKLAQGLLETASAGEGGLKLIDPAKAVGWAQAQ